MSSNFSQNMSQMVQAFMQMNANKPNNFQVFNKEYSAILDGAERAREMKHKLKTMEALNEKGKMGSPMFAGVLKKIGLDFPALFSSDSQQFEKLSYDLSKGIQAYFGSRISQGTIEMFLQTVPRRSGTKEGRRVIIDGLIEMVEPAIQKEKVLNGIIEKNGGRLPDNFLYLLSRQMEKIREKTEDKITDLIGKTIKGESKDGMEQLPDPTTCKGYYFKDRKMLDPKGNPAYFVSNGNEWVPVKLPTEADTSTIETNQEESQSMEMIE